ncbi:MAG: hypothetical protein DI629_07840 [Mesorhizobium amorphae]|nr:MAG: hypothetical protein DI629_07840 [Mesorhizobium amorphae]
MKADVFAFLLFAASALVLLRSIDLEGARHFLGSVVLHLPAGAAVLSCFWLNRQLRLVPGPECLPVSLASLALSFSLLGLGGWREVEAALLLACAATLACHAVVAMRLAKPRRQRFRLVPGGETARLFALDGAEWVALADPASDEPSCPLVVDLRAPLSPGWESFVERAALEGASVLDAKHLEERLTGRVRLERLAEHSFAAPGGSGTFRLGKAVFDRSSAFLVLVFCSPIYLLIYLAVRLDSAGPGLYFQTRMGQGGRPFRMVKFRTMFPYDAPGICEQEAAITKQDDPRITRIGKYLRRFRIDETPQAFNVLCGQMSWIGPRPEALSLAVHYRAELPFYALRHTVRPGLSGWAQVNQGHVAGIDPVRDKLGFDFFYIKHASFRLEAQIALKTIHTVLSGFGAR